MISANNTSLTKTRTEKGWEKTINYCKNEEHPKSLEQKILLWPPLPSCTNVSSHIHRDIK